ncbi:hypothetical protein C8Q70DRAFT_72097 [Cubamyces menziesii]|nr:hypothetical protein C8Q70DRAFT_72097 [Cubamyces menziesii]
MLRPPPANEDESPVPSYIAFQRWPCPERQPRWSSKINVDSRTGKWAVTLARLKIWSDVDAVSANPATLARRSPICDVATDKIPGAHKFIMDTGATSTYVHKEILTAIRKAKFLSMNQTNSSSQYPGAPYYVSRDFLQRHDVTVELTFKNTNNSLVSVYVPALGFLYNSLGEGLIWEAPANSGGQASDWSGLLGLNFFQVVYAAFHRPTYHSGIAPYIHLAPQTRADTKAGLYDVPPEKEGH